MTQKEIIELLKDRLSITVDTFKNLDEEFLLVELQLKDLNGEYVKISGDTISIKDNSGLNSLRGKAKVGF